MNLPDPESGGILASILTAVVAIGGGILALRRKVSTDGVAVVRESAERDMMGQLGKERDKYLAMWETAQEQANRFAIVNEGLRNQVDHLTKENTALALQVSRLDNNVRDLRRLVLTALPDRAGELLASDFAPIVKG